MGGVSLGTSPSVCLRHLKRKKKRKEKDKPTVAPPPPHRSHTFISSSWSLCSRYQITVSFLIAPDTGAVGINEGGHSHRTALSFSWVSAGLLLRASECLCGPVCSLFAPTGTSFVLPTEWKYVSICHLDSWVSQCTPAFTLQSGCCLCRPTVTQQACFEGKACL